MMGYAIGWGYVELPFATFMKTCAKHLFIGGLALAVAPSLIQLQQVHGRT